MYCYVHVLPLLHQVRGLCLSASGGVPASFLSSQQSAEESAAVKRELRKVRLFYTALPQAPVMPAAVCMTHEAHILRTRNCCA
jgi:hypothetical protein